MFGEYKLLIEKDNKHPNKVHVEVKGTKGAIMSGVSHLIRSLLEESSLDKEDIKNAVEIGLKNDEQLEKELKEDFKKFEETIKKLKELFN